ncbi:4-(cytidine 5'-diphospho)-2-C-methyl-D-erythritol kinase [Roseibium sp.]|uniref:4-(cytidine 5'-diphospho)-2-C-methyl-D-erythritol kinase n=1 Tax=Roseibium sp. TaxID=1936156 RepID=UPI003A977326
MTAGSTDFTATEFARAKVNLALHITGRRDDGYHLLDSLVIFPRIGDVLGADPAERLSLKIDGAFSQGLQSDSSNNLIIRAIEAFAAATGASPPALKFHLTKNLPVASGIGGGSADAAAALRIMQRVSERPLTPEALANVALGLGADVPVCLLQEPVRMQGIGEILSPAPKMPQLGIVLVNPGKAVSTPAIFKGLTRRDNPPLPQLPDRFADLDDLISYLKATRNDMQLTAEQLCPNISTVIETMSSAPETRLARMSGSGATCFALCASGQENDLAARIQKGHPEWWVASSNDVGS